jgi:hypothetical protein
MLGKQKTKNLLKERAWFIKTKWWNLDHLGRTRSFP